MNSEDARLAITAQLDAAFTAYPGTPVAGLKVQYPNRNLIDTTKQVDPYIDLDIVNIIGRQLDLNPAPLAAQYGQIVITAFCKENSGSRAAGQLLDYFLPWFERKNLSGVRTEIGMYSKSSLAKGFEGFPVTVPFWWIRVAA